MRKLALTLLGALAFLLVLVGGAEGARAQEVPLIRVALSEGTPSASFQVVQGAYTFVDEGTGVVLGSPKPGETWTVTATGTDLLVQGPGLVGSTSYRGPLSLREAQGGLNLFAFEGTKYRGDLLFHNRGGKVLVVNVLDIERYLYGVVGPEMGGGAGFAAYCAQAVASRSYALARRGTGVWYDVTKDTRTQVYKGYSGEVAYAAGGSNPVVAAVEETRGEVLVSGGRVIAALYHSNAGGHTEDVENVLSDYLPYLRGVPSPADAHALEYGGWAAGTYSWTQVVDRAALEEKLGIGTITGIEVVRWRVRVKTDPATGKSSWELVPGTRTVSGRATRVTVTGTAGTKTYYRDAIRAPFGLKSTLFDVVLEGILYVLGIQGEAQPASGSLYALGKGEKVVSLAPETRPWVLGGGGRLRACGTRFEKLIFTGKGYGHGVGLSQWGARGMALQGYSYRQILKHYYTGADIAEGYGAG